MAPHTNPAVMATSSPHSSDEATHHDTPSTTMTAFSPEQAFNADGKRGTNKANLTININAAGRNANNVGAFGDDVFLAPPMSGRSQLSPTAESFKPGHFMAHHAPRPSMASNASFLSIDSTQTITGGARLPAGLLSPVYPTLTGVVGAIGESSRSSEASPTSIGSFDLAAALGAMNIGDNDLFQNVVILRGAFTNTDNTTRGFLIANVVKPTDTLWLKETFSEIATFKGMNESQLQSRHIVAAAFTDTRDAALAMSRAQQIEPDWQLIPMAPSTLASYTGVQLGKDISDFEGHMVLVVSFDANDKKLWAKPVVSAIDHLIARVGHIKAMVSLANAPEGVVELHVEFFNSIHAHIALGELDRQVIGRIYVTTRLFNGEQFCMTRRPLTPPVHNEQFDHSPPPMSAGSPYEVPSLTGRTMVSLTDDQLSMRSQVQGRVRENINTTGSRYMRDNVYNNIVPHRIAMGLDVRTTIMLRNIPNRIDQATLKAILDATSLGDYDFLYLRIDFSNNCNVGYAFINFVNAEAILPFAQGRAGHPWNSFGPFNTNKIAEISYATIQGRENLIAKFRNSSVMCEASACRPKLFKTGRGPDAGQEEAFPAADNNSKLARSFANAQHIGLFPPRHGQVCRRALRGRRSQFDRGTVQDQLTIVDRLYASHPDIFYELNNAPMHLAPMHQGYM